MSPLPAVPEWTDPGQDGPGIHESGLHVWTFRHGDGSVHVELDADARLTVTEARAFAAQLTGVLDAIDPGHDNGAGT